MRNYVPKEWVQDKYRYAELKNACWQYGRLKQERVNILHEYRASMNGSIAVQSSSGLSPVEQKADRLNAIDSKIDKIEHCCKEATKDQPMLYLYLLKSVTERIPFEYVNVPMGKKAFYKYRRRFFYLLDMEW